MLLYGKKYLVIKEAKDCTTLIKIVFQIEFSCYSSCDEKWMSVLLELPQVWRKGVCV